MRDWAAAHPDAHWVTGEGWTYAAFPDGLPSRLQLDALVPDRPAFLVSYDGHTGWANSIGAAHLRASPARRRTRRAVEVVRDAKGDPTGVLKETAMELVERLVPKPLPHEKERALRQGIAQAAAWGLTSVHQAGIGEEDLELLAKRWTPFRGCASTWHSTWSATRPPRPSPGRTNSGGASPRTDCGSAP